MWQGIALYALYGTVNIIFDSDVDGCFGGAPPITTTVASHGQTADNGAAQSPQDGPVLCSIRILCLTIPKGNSDANQVSETSFLGYDAGMIGLLQFLAWSLRAQDHSSVLAGQVRRCLAAAGVWVVYIGGDHKTLIFRSRFWLSSPVHLSWSCTVPRRHPLPSH